MDAVSGEFLLSIGVLSVDGVAVESCGRYHPTIACLPMGWKWAMWFVQRLHDKMVYSVFDPDMVVKDFRPAPDIAAARGTAASPYCDNLAVIGQDAEEVLHLRIFGATCLREDWVSYA